MRKSITAAHHGLIDYGFGLVSVTVPTLIGLTGPGRAIPAVWAVGQSTLNALTNQPYAIRRRISFSTHGPVEAGAVPTLIAVTVASGAMKEPKNRLFFVGLFAALVTNYLLPDYTSEPAVTQSGRNVVAFPASHHGGTPIPLTDCKSRSRLTPDR